MSKNYTAIATSQLPEQVGFIHPAEKPMVIHLEDPASVAMVDFHDIRPHIVSSSENINTVTEMLRATDENVILVTDGTNNIIGLVSIEDILGEKPLRLISDRQMKRENITVKMLMTKREHITCFDKQELHLAKVGNIVSTLHEKHQHFALVVEHNEDDTHNVIGLFSLVIISKQLGTDVTSSLDAANSLATLQHSIDHDIDS